MSNPKSNPKYVVQNPASVACARAKKRSTQLPEAPLRSPRPQEAPGQHPVVAHGRAQQICPDRTTRCLQSRKGDITPCFKREICCQVGSTSPACALKESFLSQLTMKRDDAGERVYVPIWLFTLYELVSALPTVLIVYWTWCYRGGLAWNGSEQHFNWHPVLMVTGLIYFTSQCKSNAKSRPKPRAFILYTSVTRVSSTSVFESDEEGAARATSSMQWHVRCDRSRCRAGVS